MDEITGIIGSTETVRLVLAIGVIAGFVCICLAVALTVRPQRSHLQRLAAGEGWLVVYASQTGQAEDIARNTHARLSGGGAEVALFALEDLPAAALTTAKRVLFIVATTGEGEAPDNGLRFEKRSMAAMPDLTGCTFAVLALGDRYYDPFCAFGHRLFNWLQHCGASPLLPCLEVDDLDPAALARWNERLSVWGAATGQDVADGFAAWHLKARDRLNPKSPYALYRIGLTPSGAMPEWQAGDLAEIETLDGHRRDYSISSLPGEDRLDLLVREVVREDGSHGHGSGLLIHGLPLEGVVKLRVKTHAAFHAAAGEGPILMIAAGSGLAGLRPHILEAFRRKRPVWLIYGERHPVRDAALCDELRLWRQNGVLQRLDFAFSRPESGEGRYVQTVVRDEADPIVHVLGGSGAIMICGGLAMGKASESALRQALGEDWMDAAFEAGRYRRDLY